MNGTDVWTERRHSRISSSDDVREPFEIDYGRAIHSSSFRRLQGKTQILNLGDSDFYRTRLTHTLEVAQIGLGLLRKLQKNNSEPQSAHYPDAALIHVICLLHDLGHPPFGHGGEVALNYCMSDHGGFEGNAQTIRILTQLERYCPKGGSNLTRRILLGVLKYPCKLSDLANPDFRPRPLRSSESLTLIDSAIKPPKGFYDCDIDSINWILQPLNKNDRKKFGEFQLQQNGHAKTRYKSFDCSIMELADDIAYGVHDLEDAVAMGLLSRGDLSSKMSEDGWSDFLDQIGANGHIFTDRRDHFLDSLYEGGTKRKRVIGKLVGYLVNSVKCDRRDVFDEPVLDFRANLDPQQRKLLGELKAIVYEKVIRAPCVQHLEFKGQAMVLKVFEAIAAEPERLLPRYAYGRHQEAVEYKDKMRAICDYVAGMTDFHLLKVYERLYSPRMGSIFDRL